MSDENTLGGIVTDMVCRRIWSVTHERKTNRHDGSKDASLADIAQLKANRFMDSLKVQKINDAACFKAWRCANERAGVDLDQTDANEGRCWQFLCEAQLGDQVRNALWKLIHEFAWFTANQMWGGFGDIEPFDAVRPLVVDLMVPSFGTTVRFKCVIADDGNTSAKVTKTIKFKSGMKAHSMMTSTLRSTISLKLRGECGGEGFGMDAEHMQQIQSECYAMTQEEKEETTEVEVGGGKPTYVYLFRAQIQIGDDEIDAGGDGIYTRSTPLTMYGSLPDPTAAHIQ